MLRRGRGCEAEILRMNFDLKLDRPNNASSTISDAIQLQARLAPHRPALIAAGFPPLSFHELDAAIRNIGRDLSAAGIGAASRVGIVLPQGPEAALVAIAVCAHAVSVPLDAAMAASEFEFELNRASLDAVIVPSWADSQAADTARGHSVGILHVARAVRSLADIRLESSVDIPAKRRRVGAPSAQSVSIVQMSSGSTGTPKLILVTHRNLFDIAEKLRNWFGLSPADRCACLLPIYSGFGFKVALIAPLLVGSSVALPETQKPEDVAEWCCKLDPTWFVAIPPFLNATLDWLRANERVTPKHSLRFFASGTTYLPDTVRTGLETALGVPGLEFYGLREAGVVAANPAPPANRKPGTVGLVTSDVAILDGDGRRLPAGDTGAVAVRGPGISPGYIDALPIGNDTVPPPNMPSNDWQLTGDLGAIDGEGFLSIIGRTKDIINRGGEKIAPSEIERALLRHPAVREAVVFGVPHPRLGESVSAAVVLKPDSDTSSAELQSFLYEHLTASKIPQRVHAVDNLPRTQTGKVRISQLRDHFSNRARNVVRPSGSLEAVILEIWERLLRRTDIGVDDSFFELGGDSLQATTMLLEVEATTRQRISQSALRAVLTIRQVATAILDNDSADDRLVTCAKKGGGPPFFFCHGDYVARGIYALKLADLIEHDASVFLINHQRSLGEAPATIEEMARQYVPYLLSAQPAGQFRIGGYCIGGILAWEIAHQLRQIGREVEFVVLIESPSLNGRAALRSTKTFLGFASRIVPQIIRKKIQRSGMRAIWILLRSRPIIVGTMRKWLNYVPSNRVVKNEAYRRDDYCKVSNYIPAVIDTELYCLLCDANAKRMDYRPAPWRHYARTVHAKMIPGDHNSCVTTFAVVVANELQRIFSGRRSQGAL
jgi:acyl-CoA synthetase (AMP-forming)/AMP-acid ligase II/thioesterase domain-containing protein/acyl carrier protein